LDKLLLYFIKILDPVVNQEYVMIYVHTNSGSENIPKFAFLRKCYGIFSRKYKKNLKALYIVQPTSLVKGIAKLFKPFLSNKFWKKLFYITEIKELYQFMNPQQVQLPIELLPSSNTSKPEIFGVHLEEVMKHPMNMYSPVPLIVLNCMKYLLKNGTHVEGIFRLSGRAQRIEELKDAYDRGEVVDFSSEPDIHVIAGLLKLYFRKLPDPLCCHSLYREWIASWEPTDTELSKNKIKVILKKLPRANYLTLNSLLGLLSLLKDKEEVTKMTANNLAICWAPNILRPPEESLSSALADSNIVNNIISLLISEFHVFFPVGGFGEDSIPYAPPQNTITIQTFAKPPESSAADTITITTTTTTTTTTITKQSSLHRRNNSSSNSLFPL
jgi:Rho GTPase-activating protein 1